MLSKIKPNRQSFEMLIDGLNQEKFSKPYRSFSTNFIKNILNSVSLYIDIGAKDGYYTLMAGFYHPNLRILSIEQNQDCHEALSQNIENLDLKNITLAPRISNLRNDIFENFLKEERQKSLLIRIFLDEDMFSNIDLIVESLKLLVKAKLIIEPSKEIIQSRSAELRNVLNKILVIGFEIWELNDHFSQFWRVRTTNSDESFNELASEIYYCVQKPEALSICFFSHSPGLGGSERVMLELVESLVKKFGAVCTIVLPTIGPQLQVHKDIGASSLIGFPAFNQFGWWCDERQGLSQEYKQQFLLACDESIKLNVIGSLNKIDPDLIWTQSIVAPWGARVSKYLNKPHIWYVTEFGERDFGFNFFTPFKEVIDEVQKSSNHVFTCSQILKDSLFPDANDQKVSVLYSHIKAPILNTKPSIFKYFQKKESVKLGMFSQVRHSKGQEDAVLALAECTRNGFNVELVIAGGADPDYLRHLINLAKENGVLELINFSGYEANPFELMDMCDIVIMSSRLEAFGRVGVEAMLLEKPVVFANTGGISEYQIDGKTGFSYAPGDTTDLALKLMHLVSDKTLRVNMGLSGKEHALKIFSEENFSGRVFEYAQKIIKLGRGNCKSPIIIENFLKKALADKAPLKDRRESVGRNDKCPCGSQIKYKRCCGSN